MDALKKIVETIDVHVADVKAEIAKAEEKGFVYARSKTIRALAQSLKLAAQDLRVMTSDEFKKAKGE